MTIKIDSFTSDQLRTPAQLRDTAVYLYLIRRERLPGNHIIEYLECKLGNTDYYQLASHESERKPELMTNGAMNTLEYMSLALTHLRRENDYK